MTTSLPALADDDLGTDIGSLDDLSPQWAMVSGNTNLAMALYRRLRTPAGDLFYDASYGFDIRSLLNASMTAASVSAAKSAIKAQCMLDPRVQSVDVTMTFANKTLTIVINAESAIGPFDLVMRATQVSVDVLRLAGVDVVAAARPDAVVVQVAGPKGDTGIPGSGGGGVGSTLAPLDDEAEKSVTDTTETVVFQCAFNFAPLGATITGAITAMLFSASGTSTFRLRVGGSDGVADGTVIATLTRATASYAAATGSGTFSNPAGVALVKITAQNAVNGQPAKIKDKTVTFA